MSSEIFTFSELFGTERTQNGRQGQAENQVFEAHVSRSLGGPRVPTNIVVEPVPSILWRRAPLSQSTLPADHRSPEIGRSPPRGSVAGR